MNTRISKLQTNCSQESMPVTSINSKPTANTSKALLLGILLLFVSGCATTSTLNQPLHERNPLVMSGIRLDLASLRNDAQIVEKFGVAGPDFPLLDLPFSAFLDFIVLGYTLPVALIYRH